MVEYKSKKDLPKKQVHIYIYSDIERILKAFGIKPAEFLTQKTLELLGKNNINSKFGDITAEIEKLENKKKDLQLELDKCEEELSELNLQLSNIKLLMNNYVPTDEKNFEDAMSEVLGLVANRANSDKRMPYIYYDDVIPICEKYGVNYQFVLSKVPENALSLHFKLRYKRK